MIFPSTPYAYFLYQSTFSAIIDKITPEKSEKKEGEEEEQSTFSAIIDKITPEKKELSEKVTLQACLQENYELLLAAYEEADSLRNSILPTAEANFSATDYGYRQGQFNFIDVLAAQKNLFEVREQLLDSLSDFHKRRLNIEALTGQKLADSRNHSSTDPISITGDK